MGRRGGAPARPEEDGQAAGGVGPAGCGKTRGVRSQVKACGLRVAEVHGASAESISQLMGWMKSVRSLRGRGTALFLDDFEGFTVEVRQAATAL